MNCNTLFSVHVARKLTDAEREWLRVKNAERENYWADEVEDEADADYWANLEGIGFEVTEAGDFLVISDEFGSPDAAAGFIQEFLAEFRPTEGVVFEWAHTATKMIPGEFGGGAAVITGGEIRWLAVNGWAQATMQLALGSPDTMPPLDNPVTEPVGGHRVCSVCGTDIAFDPLDLHGCEHCQEPICPACARDGHRFCLACA